MLLGPVSWLDCIVFLVFLAPQLIIQAGLFRTLFCGLQALPFLGTTPNLNPHTGDSTYHNHIFVPKWPVIKLPLSFFRDRFVSRQRRAPFVRKASWFEDIAIRCVRYAFTYIPPNIGKVFFSKYVALPFLRFRMLRHGYFRSPIRWRQVYQKDFRGLWISTDESQEPDIVIYYVHGGGFSLGSSCFYLEFLLAWLHMVKSTGGFRNPAIFALDYTLVPDKLYPVQLQQEIAGYRHILSITQDASKICISGESAGATLILSLLLHLAKAGPELLHIPANSKEQLVPGFVVLISPWVTLVSSKHRNTSSDYLDAEKLHQYAIQYAGLHASTDDPMVSPGKCKNMDWWKRASPSRGFLICYGSEEVFAPEIIDLIEVLRKADVRIDVMEEIDGIHAWPVGTFFLSSSREKRQKPLQMIVNRMCERMRK